MTPPDAVAGEPQGLLRFCSCGCGGRYGGARRQPLPADRPFTIDVHAHVMDLSVERLLAGHPLHLQDKAAAALSLGAEAAAYNARSLGPRVREPLTSVARRLADMDAMGVDLQLLSPAPGQYCYWAPEPLAEQIVELQNAGLAALCRRHPGRFLALGNLALQHPSMAVAQLRRAMAVHGLAGVEVSTAVEGRELCDPALEAFWAAAEEQQAVVFIHPLGTSAWPRLDTGYLTNAIGQPLETTFALSRLIAAGVLDRYPALRLLAAHGGGYLPGYFGRTDHAYCVRPEARTSRHPPSHYLRRIWFDSIVHDPLLLRHLIDVVGVERVVLGSDYPYDMGVYELHAFLGDVPRLGGEDAARICGRNALDLLSLRLADLPVPDRQPAGARIAPQT